MTEKIRVLLVDDHALFRSGVKALLERHDDFEVLDEASDGLEGIKRARSLKPDLVLLDLHMPGISGLEAVKVIVEEMPGVPVLFHFHTPYYGLDELLLDAGSRNAAVDCLQECRRHGLPVMNSVPALERLRPGRGSGSAGLFYVVDSTGEYRCCRALGDPAVCQHCGYSACEEIRLVRNDSMLPAPSPVPPGVIGFDAGFRSDMSRFDRAAARALRRPRGRRGPAPAPRRAAQRA